MVEAHYRSAVGSDPNLVAWFHVRLYKNGRMWVRAIADNGWLDLANQDKTYVPTVTIGGAQVWNNGGASLFIRAPAGNNPANPFRVEVNYYNSAGTFQGKNRGTV